MYMKLGHHLVAQEIKFKSICIFLYIKIQTLKNKKGDGLLKIDFFRVLENNFKNNKKCEELCKHCKFIEK